MQNNYSIKRCFQILLKLLPMLFWILLIFGFDLPYIAIMTLITAIIHELGHILATCKIIGNFKLKSAIGGLRLSTKIGISYKNEIIISASGPLANLFVFLLLLPFFKFNDYLLTFGIINLLTAFSNLLPIESYDGYRIILSFGMLFGFGDTFIGILQKLSFVLLSLLSFIALYLMKKADVGYWIFFIFIAILIKTITRDRNIFFTRK